MTASTQTRRLGATAETDPLQTLAIKHGLKRMTRAAMMMVLGALANVASSALATPPPPPAAHTWTRIAWECPGKERSSIEIGQLAQGSSGYQTEVIGLVIEGRKIDPAMIDGLREMVARRNFLRPVGGYCETSGEMIGIEEIGNGPKQSEAGWRGFHIPYPTRP